MVNTVTFLGFMEAITRLDPTLLVVDVKESVTFIDPLDGFC